jgi:23S rRNA (uracil1939-C5)-methyltransferase
VSEVTVRGIATGGDGVATLPDGMTVFVPRTAPGDVVTVDVLERRRRWARGRVRDVLSPSGDRVTPVCRHYVADGCGGCQLQHLSLEAQHAAKITVVRDVLARLGGRPVEETAFVPAPNPWHYRTKITLAVAGDRIGFHRFDRPGEVFDVVECPVTVPALIGVLDAVRAARGALPPTIDQITLRVDRNDGVHVVLRGGSTPFESGPFAEALPAGTTLWWKPEGGAPRAIAGASSAFPPLAFQQVNPGFADRIRHDAVAWLAAEPGTVMWDLYGGFGDAARMVAELGATAWSVDADRSAINWARAHPGPTTPVPRFLAGRVEESLHRLPDPDVVLANPPREGVHARVTQALERLVGGGHGRRLSYVSCDPATLARDLGRLPSYRLRSVTAYDLFPQTSHVETLACLEAA